MDAEDEPECTVIAADRALSLAMLTCDCGGAMVVQPSGERLCAWCLTRQIPCGEYDAPNGWRVRAFAVRRPRAALRLV